MSRAEAGLRLSVQAVAINELFFIVRRISGFYQ